MSRLKRKPLFVLRARTVGVKSWTCVLCGTINRATVTARTFKIRCTERSCRARFAFGEVFYLLPGGGHIAPPMDMMIPSAAPMDSFPAGTLATEEYRSGRGVHQLIESDVDDATGAGVDNNDADSAR